MDRAGTEQRPRLRTAHAGARHAVAVLVGRRVSAAVARGAARIGPLQPGGVVGQLATRFAARQSEVAAQQSEHRAGHRRRSEGHLHQLLE